MEYTGRKGISAAVLKNIAVITMTIDHVTAFLLKDYLRSVGVTDLYSNEWYLLGRIIGRIAFVLYAFMVAEGAYHTRNKVKYAGRLLALAVISIVPHSYVNAGKWFYKDDLNIFFLLFTGLLAIYGCDWLKKNIENKTLSILLQLAVTAAACAVSLLLKFEYGMMGILLILVFHEYRYDFPKLALHGFLVMSVGYMAHVIIKNGAVQWIQGHSANLLLSILKTDRIQIWGLLAFPLIFLYNGEKGRQLPKPFYYFFYPVHLGIIALIMYL